MIDLILRTECSVLGMHDDPSVCLSKKCILPQEVASYAKFFRPTRMQMGNATVARCKWILSNLIYIYISSVRSFR